MKPTLGDPCVWVDGKRFDLSDPDFVRAPCVHCGETADLRVLFMGERGPHHRLDCPACGYRAPAISREDLLALVLANAAGIFASPFSDDLITWIEWQKIRTVQGTGIGGRFKPREVVPPKAARARRCRSCANCSHEPANNYWCDEDGQYVDGEAICSCHSPKPRKVAA